MAGERTAPRLTTAEERKMFRRIIDEDIRGLQSSVKEPFAFYAFGPKGMPDFWGAAKQPQRETAAIKRAARALKSLNLNGTDLPEGADPYHFQQYTGQITTGVNRVLYNRGRQVTTIQQLERNLAALRQQHDPEKLEDDSFENLNARTIVLGAQSMVTIAKLVLQKLDVTFRTGPGQNGHTPH